VTISFLTDDYVFTLKLFRHQHSIFQRFIGYCGSVTPSSDGNKKLTYKFIARLIHGLPLSGLCEYSDWNVIDQEQIIDDLLGFMMVNKTTIDSIFRLDNEHSIETMFAMFIFNENYNSQLAKFMKILSDSNFYSNDNNFSNLLKNVFQSVKRKKRPKGRIGEAITILQTLERQDVLNQMYSLFLTIEPDAFRSIYYPASNHYTILHLKTNLSSLLESDSYRMTHIHRAFTETQ
jgi:hypothetical protein